MNSKKVLSIVMATMMAISIFPMPLAATLDFPNGWLKDTTPPVITFVPLTPENNSEVNVNYVFVNVTVEDESEISTVSLNWNGSNETMICAGYMNFYLNKTGLGDGVYVYNVYADDIYGNTGVSETRVVKVNIEKMCGDVNCDEMVDIGDVTLLLNHVGDPEKYSLYDEWAGDVNCDKVIDIGDVTLLLNHVGDPEKYPPNCC